MVPFFTLIMSVQELELRLTAAKKYLQGELINRKIVSRQQEVSPFEINIKLDKIHEIERKGFRNLSEDQTLRITKFIVSIEELKSLSPN